jgi:hypothetical protein
LGENASRGSLVRFFLVLKKIYISIFLEFYVFSHFSKYALRLPRAAPDDIAQTGLCVQKKNIISNRKHVLFKICYLEQKFFLHPPPQVRTVAPPLKLILLFIIMIVPSLLQWSAPSLSESPPIIKILDPPLMMENGIPELGGTDSGDETDSGMCYIAE